MILMKRTIRRRRRMLPFGIAVATRFWALVQASYSKPARNPMHP
jgi:hypothetical protein